MSVSIYDIEKLNEIQSKYSFYYKTNKLNYFFLFLNTSVYLSSFAFSNLQKFDLVAYCMCVFFLLIQFVNYSFNSSKRILIWLKNIVSAILISVVILYFSELRIFDPVPFIFILVLLNSYCNAVIAYVESSLIQISIFLLLVSNFINCKLDFELVMIFVIVACIFFIIKLSIDKKVNSDFNLFLYCLRDDFLNFTILFVLLIYKTYNIYISSAVIIFLVIIITICEIKSKNFVYLKKNFRFKTKGNFIKSSNIIIESDYGTGKSTYTRKRIPAFSNAIFMDFLTLPYSEFVFYDFYKLTCSNTPFIFRFYFNLEKIKYCIVFTTLFCIPIYSFILKAFASPMDELASLQVYTHSWMMHYPNIKIFIAIYTTFFIVFYVFFIEICFWNRYSRTEVSKLIMSDFKNKSRYIDYVIFENMDRVSWEYFQEYIRLINSFNQLKTQNTTFISEISNLEDITERPEITFDEKFYDQKINLSIEAFLVELFLITIGFFDSEIIVRFNNSSHKNPIFKEIEKCTSIELAENIRTNVNFLREDRILKKISNLKKKISNLKKKKINLSVQKTNLDEVVEMDIEISTCQNPKNYKTKEISDKFVELRNIYTKNLNGENASANFRDLDNALLESDDISELKKKLSK